MSTESSARQTNKSTVCLICTADLPLEILPALLQLYSTQNTESRKRRVTHSLIRVGLLPSSFLSTVQVSEREWLNYTSHTLVGQGEVTKTKKNKVMSSVDHLRNLLRSCTINKILFLEIFAYFMCNKRCAQLPTIVAIILAPNFSCSGYISAQVILCIR